MHLPVLPPLPPMLARLARELPADGFLYEPKWDGFRCLAFRDGGEVDLRSRHDRPLARYFPELVEALSTLARERIVLDGEIIVAGPNGFDFAALLARLHPAASRVARLAGETPATFVAFDLLALDAEDVRRRPFRERRAALEEALAGVRPPLALTPVTEDTGTAARWLQGRHDGIDGVVAKDASGAYEPGIRALVKVKTERTADCVVAGFRLHEDRPLPSSLLLGLYDDEGALRHVGIAASFGERLRESLLADLGPLATSLEGHPWARGFLTAGSRMGRLKGAAARWVPEMGLDWVPVRPERVCEVSYDRVDRDRFRHPARFRRWRPDREPRSCTFEQLETAPLRLEDILART